MFERAIAALKAGEASALRAFNDEKNKDFRDRDLYVDRFSLPDGNITTYQSPDRFPCALLRGPSLFNVSNGSASLPVFCDSRLGR